MVVGVEPLRHFEWRDGVRPTGSGKVAVQRIGDRRDAVGQRAEKNCGVEHLVVEGEGIDRDGVEAQVTEVGQALPTEVTGDSLQGVGVDAPCPVAFGCPLEFSMRTDAR